MWQLVGRRIIVTGHVEISAGRGHVLSREYHFRIGSRIKEYFHHLGIHSTTIQIEYSFTDARSVPVVTSHVSPRVSAQVGGVRGHVSPGRGHGRRAPRVRGGQLLPAPRPPAGGHVQAVRLSSILLKYKLSVDICYKINLLLHGNRSFYTL